DIRGRAGRTLRQEWAAGPKAYLGVGAAGFPNLFIVTGPGSPSVLSNMVVSIEQHVDWIADCITSARAEGHTTVEATDEAQGPWRGPTRPGGTPAAGGRRRAGGPPGRASPVRAGAAGPPAERAGTADPSVPCRPMFRDRRRPVGRPGGNGPTPSGERRNPASSS